MKTRNLLLGAMGLFAMASCSNDEVISVNHDGDEITFSVATNSVSRAEEVYCNDKPPTQFYLSATYDNKVYIEADNVEYNNTSSMWENQSGTRYWPNTDDTHMVTFFAYHNAEQNNFNWNTDLTQPTVNFTVNGTVANQKDFIYAKTTQSKPSSGGEVTLNFRHALSQIVFEAKNTNSNLYVEIYGVSVCNVKGGTATFTYPTDDMSADTQNKGSWDLTGDGTTTQKYIATFNKVGLEGDNTTTPLTSDNANNAMLLLPQNGNTKWESTTNTAGTHLLVNCKIYNVKKSSEESIDVGNEVCLWGANATDGKGKDVLIPVALNWDQGKKYIYTFVFGEGNGGYNPDAPDDPILVPITFKVTVDEFKPVSDDDQQIPINPIPDEETTPSDSNQ